jgi:(1->4)-alpha-D-glucan 1-alpha-D-glucosylmutase
MHDFNIRRLRDIPLSLNATATHDTKRGEDARARLNVISELPDDWKRNMRQWSRYNARHKTFANGTEMPSRTSRSRSWRPSRVSAPT